MKFLKLPQIHHISNNHKQVIKFLKGPTGPPIIQYFSAAQVYLNYCNHVVSSSTTHNDQQCCLGEEMSECKKIQYTNVLQIICVLVMSSKTRFFGNRNMHAVFVGL